MAALAPLAIQLQHPQVQQLHHRLLAGERPPPHDLAETGVDRLEGVRRVHDAPDLRAAGEELPHLVQAALPHRDGARVARPLPAEVLPGRLGGGQRGRAVDRAYGAAERRGLLLRDVPQRVADQVDDAALVGRRREDRPQALPEPGPLLTLL